MYGFLVYVNGLVLQHVTYTYTNIMVIINLKSISLSTFLLTLKNHILSMSDVPVIFMSSPRNMTRNLSAPAG